jgi:hypothetical protein
VDDDHPGDLDYKADPGDMLKGYLYRPNNRLVASAEVGFNSLGSVTASGGFSWLFIPIPLPEIRKIKFRGTMTLLAGYYTRNLARDRLTISLTYDQQYYRTISWYIRGHWVNDRSVAERRPGVNNLGFGGGVSLMPIRPTTRRGIGWLTKSMKLRLGLAMDTRDWFADLSRMRLEVALAVRTR